MQWKKLLTVFEFLKKHLFVLPMTTYFSNVQQKETDNNPVPPLLSPQFSIESQPYLAFVPILAYWWLFFFIVVYILFDIT